MLSIATKVCSWKLRKDEFFLPGKLSIIAHNAKLKSSPHSSHKVIGESQHTVAYRNGFRSATLTDQQFVYCQIDVGKTWVYPSGIMSVLSVCHGVGVVARAQCAFLLLSNWISISKPCWTYRRAKWGTTHLRITSVTCGTGQLMLWLSYCVLKPTWLLNLMTTEL